MKKKMIGKMIKSKAIAKLISLGMASALCLSFLGGCSDVGEVSVRTQESSHDQSGTQSSQDPLSGDAVLTNIAARQMIKTDYAKTEKAYVPSVAAYQVKADLSNVKDINRYYLSNEEKQLLAANNFFVRESQYNEFFNIYEGNRYGKFPNFVTTDSMMHTYHLYFAMLQENTERKYLMGSVKTLTERMMELSGRQLEKLQGTQWESAAWHNYAYFCVAARLMGVIGNNPAAVNQIVEEELSKIYAARDVDTCGITDALEDYTQYKPRGYYDGDEQLEKYFRTMMWYGRMNFTQTSEESNRCALLMALNLKDATCFNAWDAVYEVTSFFVGESDDLGFYEYLPCIDDAYGVDASLEKIVSDQAGWNAYLEGIKKLRAPEINSMVFPDDEGETDKTEAAKGFRFMGQRFTMDAAVFTQLCYSKVKEAEDGSKRMLPDGLDVPAAMGSDLALDLLKQKGVTAYPNYLENLEKVRKKVRESDEYWSSSLYGGWLHTLAPLLEKKGAGYPSFMTNEEWQKKSLEGYLGSWTELKHDTILYAKQMMAEMGGDDIEDYDDRGYVEPEPELYGRLSALTSATSEGLTRFGVISDEDKEGLSLLGSLSDKLQTISIKELQNEPLTDEEFELIRGYGGTIEHLWADTIKNKTNKEYWDSAEFPMALVADVATDPNGSCLQVAIGGASVVYVAFPLDGEIHLGMGGVFNYYQFAQPISDRLTDKEWRIMMGMQLDDNDEYHVDRSITVQDCARSYRHSWYYGY